MPDDRQFRRSFADEVAIDFPSARAAVECLRRDGMSAEALPTVATEVVLDRAKAARGAVVPLLLEVPLTCRDCGGRGEVWEEPCAACEGSGQSVSTLCIDVRVPPGVTDGDAVRFVVTPRRGPSTRVDVRFAVL